MSPLRIVASLALFAAFAWMATLNWITFWRRTVLREATAPSWIPAVGGFMGFVAFSVAGVPAIEHYSWLPLILDYGTLPGLTHTAVFLALRSVRRA